ncbi:MAG: hypothetical protein Q7V56_01400 [Gammaproteobacteria bacterium]|nr:hypothetical protein [Gammaproteobacteria bacterium]
MKFNKLLAVIAIFLNLCAINTTQAQTANNHCDVLYAGQTTAVGSVCVTVNASDVNLDYLLIGDWQLTEAHAWIGDSLASLPTNASGNPQIGLFPYQADINSAAQYSFTIPISQLAVNVDTFCNAEIFVAAHAVVTRTVAGGSDDDESDDDGDDGKSDKSGKNEKSGKAGKSGKSSSASKSSTSSASSGKGTAYNAVASNSSSKGKSKASGKAGKSDQSGKADKSGQSNKSGKSGDQTGDGSSQPATQTESAWAGSMQIANGGSWASYFSFTNDFCATPVDPYPVVVLPTSCFNVFGRGATSITEPVTASGFTPVGVTDTTNAWLNTYSSSPSGYFGGDLVRDNGTIVGTFLAGLGGNSDFAVELTLDSNASPSLVVRSANVYFDTAGGYLDMSPLDYGLSLVGNGTGSLIQTVPLIFTPGIMDTIVHAVVCTAGIE